MNQGGVHFQWHSNGMPGDINDIFRNFGFGGDPFGHIRPQQARRNKDLRIELPLNLVDTLEDQTRTISLQTTTGTRETVEVLVPRGVTSGTQMKYPGLGDNMFNTIPRGDLYVQITVHPVENFQINGIDLYTKFSVNCLTAIVGGTANISGIDGKEFAITIPPGTQPGIKFRLSQQGLYQMHSPRKGDLYAEMSVTIPQNLPEQQLDTIRSFIQP